MAKLGGYYYSKKRDKGLASYAKKARKAKRKTVQSLGATEVEHGVSMRGKATFVLIILLFLAGLYFLLFSNFFKVQKAVLMGNDKIKSDDIENIIKDVTKDKRFYVFSGDSILMVNDGRIKREIMDKIPLVSAVSVKKSLPGTLKIGITEMSPFAIWETNNKKYLVDLKGNVCYEISNDQKLNLPIIYDKENKSVEVKGQATFPSQINFIRNTLDSLKKDAKLEVDSVSLPNSLGLEVDIKTKDGFTIYFNTDRSVESQIRDLKSVLEKQIGDNKSKLQYIDLRVEDWVYYK